MYIIKRNTFWLHFSLYATRKSNEYLSRSIRKQGLQLFQRGRLALHCDRVSQKEKFSITFKTLSLNHLGRRTAPETTARGWSNTLDVLGTKVSDISIGR